MKEKGKYNIELNITGVEPVQGILEAILHYLKDESVDKEARDELGRRIREAIVDSDFRREVASWTLDRLREESTPVDDVEDAI